LSTTAKTNENHLIKTVHQVLDNKAPPHQIVVDQTAANIATVKKLLECANNHDIAGYGPLFSPDALFEPEDVPPIPMDGFLKYCLHLHGCFPDCKFTYTSIKKSTENFAIVVDGARFSGTHTGGAYSPDPTIFPPIPPTGTTVVNDEERWFFYFDPTSGKIKSWAVIALGPSTGPLGAYEILRLAM